MSEKNNQNNNLSFPEREERVLDFWEKSGTFNKSLTKETPRGDYAFYDGPPFATGTPHYGHIVASLMKDIIPRYQTMRGYHVDRKWGWDCHGLPIENIVEKELGTKSKKDIEELGVGKFNDLCRNRVLTYVDEWKKVIRRFGRWADIDNAYKTMDLDFMDSIWWAFKKLWEAGLIYQDYRSMHICPRCETTLSQSEVSEGYKDIKDWSVTVKFAVVDEPDTYFLAWTTTPWTLIGNVALAVGGDIKYVKAKVGTEIYILAEKLVETVLEGQEYEIISKLEGYDLAGKSYQPLFDYYSLDTSLENHANGWKVYTADFVTTLEGTGIVHIAPAFGEDDMDLGKSKKLPFVQHVSLDGVFKPEVKAFAGLHVKPLADHMATDVEIIKYLAKQNSLFKKAKYEHSYPHCWRCDTPLLNYATSSWFVAVTKIKDQLLENAKGINWSPGYIKEGRFGNWLKGARDWSISRQRFWASVIPIWECATCDYKHVVGSVAELEELTGKKVDDIHKDKVDPLTFACPKCGGEMKRVSDVLDCWFESGSMPFAQMHYPFENKDKFEHNFPAQFIAEGIDQTRTWFYYLHVVSGGIFQKRSFDNVIVNGIVLAEDGKKMSKRLKNYPDPLKIMEKYGSDAIRAYLAASPVMQSENLNFSEKGVQESLRKNIMLLWNIYKFYNMFASEDKVASLELKHQSGSHSKHVLDVWILSKLAQLVASTTAALEAYNLPKALRPITEFIDELSTWYIRRSRDRFKSADISDKNQALATTRYVLLTLSKLIAPFTPFIAETLWQNLNGFDFKDADQSVHLETWPEVDLAHNNDAVLKDMAQARQIVEAGLAARDAAGIKIRQMLAGLTVFGSKPLTEAYLRLIKDELNLQMIEFSETEEESLRVKLDTKLTPELKREGYKRELIRFINLLRKEKGLNKDQAVGVNYQAEPELAKILESLAADICRETATSAFVSASGLSKAKTGRSVKLGEATVMIALDSK